MLGKRLGPYEIIEELGRGGMSTVYRAYHPAMERYVAVKVLRNVLANDSESVERFIREARLIARLEHPHLLPVYDFSADNEPAFIVMRYLEGATLNDVIDIEGRLPLNEVVHVVRQVATALDYANRVGVVHRDLKPSNVMIDVDGNAFLTDFGIAQMVEDGGTITQTGAAVGTPAYMSPEQINGEEFVSPATDIYSFAVLIFELTTGHLPFKANTLLDLMRQHIEEPVPSAKRYVPELPDVFDKIINKAMAKNPTDRFRSASEMGRYLEALLSRQEALRKIEVLKRVAHISVLHIQQNRRETQILLMLNKFEGTRTSGVMNTYSVQDTMKLLDTPGKGRHTAQISAAKNPFLGRIAFTAIGVIVLIGVMFILALSNVWGNSGEIATEQVQTRIAFALAETQTAQPTITLTPSPSPTATVALQNNQVANAFLNVPEALPTPIFAGSEVFSDEADFQININHLGTELEDARLYALRGSRIFVDNASNRGIQLLSYFDSHFILHSGGYTTGVTLGFENLPLVFLYLEGGTCAAVAYEHMTTLNIQCLKGQCSYSLEGLRGVRRYINEGQSINISVEEQTLGEVSDISMSSAIIFESFLMNTGSGHNDLSCIEAYLPTETPTPTRTAIPILPTVNQSQNNGYQ